jgi:hypothetical protein
LAGENLSNWNKEPPPVLFCPQIVDSSGIEVGLALQEAGVYTHLNFAWIGAQFGILRCCKQPDDSDTCTPRL